MQNETHQFSYMFEGSLFTSEFLRNGIRDIQAWQLEANPDYQKFHQAFDKILANLPNFDNLQETDTAQQTIIPILESLGWNMLYEQQSENYRPDALLFLDAKARDKAQKETKMDNRYKQASLIGEFKKWNLPLDKVYKDDSRHRNAPSTQILNYLSHADTTTSGRILWGILTNGNDWRLYYHKAISRSEDFFELSLEKIAACDTETRAHWEKIFYLVFSAKSFTADILPLEFYQEGKRWERNLAENLSQLIFDEIFTHLVSGIKYDAKDKALADDLEIL